jgi:hypothetical protein
VDPEPEFAEPEPERPAGKRSRKGKQAASGSPEELTECFFCFASIPASAQACPECGETLQHAAAPARGGRGRSRVAAAPLGAVQVFAALKAGALDFKNNALFCLLAIVIVEVATTVVAVLGGVGGGFVAGLTGSIPGAIIAALLAIAFTMSAVAYLLQGLFAFWLACARDEKVSLRLLFSPPLAGGLSGAMVQVMVMVAYVGLSIGIGFLINRFGSLPVAIAGSLLFFTICCLLVLISGFAQVYIVDQGLSSSAALGAATHAVTSAKAKLLGYAAICVGVVFVVTLIVGVVLSVVGLSPKPINPSFGKLVVCTLIQAGVSLALFSVVGTSFTRIYLQLSGR